MAEKSERKPLIEALAARKDGLDILVKMLAEARPEEKREEKAPDMFAGLSNMLGMMIMPMILPSIIAMMQEAITQTLTASTLNVKIESSVAMLPISIEANTVIMPVEIRASQVTLNVQIVGATTLNVHIESAETVSVVVREAVTVIQQSGTFFEIKPTGDATFNIQPATGVVFNIRPATDAIFNIQPVSTAVFNVQAKDGYFNIRTESGVVLNIWTPSGRWVTGAGASSFGRIIESYWSINPNDKLSLRVVDGERGVLKSVGFIIAWSSLAYTTNVFDKLQIEVYADQDPDSSGAVPVWQSTSTGIDLLSGGYVTGLRAYNLLTTNAVNRPQVSNPKGCITWVYVNSSGYITACGGYINLDVECMSDLYVVFKNLHSGEAIRVWYAIEYGVYP